MTLVDNYRHKGLRKQLIQKIKQKGIHDIQVLKAMFRVPRHLFVESYLDAQAYDDRALPIESGQTISQPYTVAFQTQLLQVKKGDKVLEVGTGSGYQTAVLLELGCKVYSVERKKELYIRTRQILDNLGYKPQLFYGDGYKGKPTYGPFDKVLITAGAPKVPDALLEQLKLNGRLVAPIGNTETQIMTTIDKVASDKFQKKNYGYFVFVPMLKGVE